MRTDYILTKEFNGAVHLLCTKLEAPFTGTTFEGQEEVYIWAPYQADTTGRETGAKPVKLCSNDKAVSLRQNLENSFGTPIFAQSTPAGAQKDYFQNMKVAKLMTETKLEII